MQPFVVPVVDIAPYLGAVPRLGEDLGEDLDGARAAERAAVAEALYSACATAGFVQITGHGVPDDVIAGLAAAMDAFFGQDLEIKQTYRTPPEINRGYAPPRSESLSLSLGVEQASRMNDFFEAFNVGSEAADYPDLELPPSEYAPNVWPRSEPGFRAETFRAAVEAYFAQAGRVARVLTRIFADALDTDPEVFAGATSHSIDVLLFLNNYALPEGAVDVDGDLIGMGEHTDYGIVTVLWADQVPGLQVLGTDQTWHDVQPADGALLVNLGDLTARWTNDRWRSTLHRVKPPVVDGRIMRRRSAAYFHDGNIDAVISTLPSCVEESADPAVGSPYAPITVGEHLAAKLAGSRAGVANTGAGSEAERVLSARN